MFGACSQDGKTSVLLPSSLRACVLHMESKCCTSLNRSIVSDRGVCQVWVAPQLPARESESWPELHGEGRQPKLQLPGEPRRQGAHHGWPDLICMADLQGHAVPGWDEGIWQPRLLAGLSERSWSVSLNETAERIWRCSLSSSIERSWVAIWRLRDAAQMSFDCLGTERHFKWAFWSDSLFTGTLQHEMSS